MRRTHPSPLRLLAASLLVLCPLGLRHPGGPVLARFRLRLPRRCHPHELAAGHIDHVLVDTGGDSGIGLYAIDPRSVQGDLYAEATACARFE